MGYYSNFLLAFKKADNSGFSDEEAAAIENEISQETGLKANESAVSGVQKMLVIEYWDIKWYDWLEDLTRIMRERPDLSLHVTREGEDHDDTEKAYWEAGGEEFVDCSDIVISRPDPPCDGITVAVLDSKDSSLALITVPAGSDPDEWLARNLAHFDSNCTWQAVDILRAGRYETRICGFRSRRQNP